MLLLVTLDTLVGLLVYHGATATADVTKARSGTTAEVLIVFPGFIMPSRQLSASFAPLLPDDTAMIVIGYPEREMDAENMFRVTREALQTLHPTSIRIYGASMGGMCAVELLRRYTEAGAPFGPAQLYLDTAPANTSDIKMPGWTFSLARWYRGGPLGTLISAATNSSQDIPVEEHVDLKIVDSAHRDARWTSLPAMTGQARFMADFQRPKADERLAASKVVFLQANEPHNDPLVNVPQAIEHWRTGFPELTIVSITSRDGHWHVPLIERPAETLSALLR